MLSCCRHVSCCVRSVGMDMYRLFATYARSSDMLMGWSDLRCHGERHEHTVEWVGSEGINTRQHQPSIFSNPHATQRQLTNWYYLIILVPSLVARVSGHQSELYHRLSPFHIGHVVAAQVLGDIIEFFEWDSPFLSLWYSWSDEVFV